MKMTTIIFDFDGTIANTVDYSYEKIVDISQNDLSVKKDKTEIIKDLRNKTYLELLREFRLSFLHIPKILKLVKQTQKDLYKHIDEIEVFAGIKETLTELRKRGYRLAILSSNIEESIERFLKKNKINIFDYLDCGSNILGKGRAIKAFLKKNNLTPEEVIYVGDEVRDIKACKKNKVKIIAVSWGMNSKDILKKHQADFVVSKPSDILRLGL